MKCRKADSQRRNMLQQKAEGLAHNRQGWSVSGTLAMMLYNYMNSEGVAERCSNAHLIVNGTRSFTPSGL